MSEKIVHQGRSVKRIREILGKKQDELAVDLGITQQAISLLEGKETIDPKMLEDVAKALHVPVDAIKNFNEEAAISIVANTFTDHAILNGINYNPTFNPIDKWVDALEENKKLYAALLKEKDEKIALLEKLLADKK